MSWYIYFITKLALAMQGRLQLDPWLNLPLACLAFFPFARRRWQMASAVIAWPAALLLLANESGASLNTRLLHQLQQITGFSASYALELGWRLLEDGVLPAALALVLFGLWLNRWLRLDVLICAVLLAIPLATSLHRMVATPITTPGTESVRREAHDADPQARLQDFWASERQRVQRFAPGQRPPFDVVLLHICSLSWDDLDAVGLGSKSLFGRFDLVFEQFNSVTSYSGPSMLRLMRANCGQTPHDALYRAAGAPCGLLQQLRLSGYEVQAYLNHDGRFEGFADTLQAEAAVNIQAPVRSTGTRAALRAFDGSPIAGDHATLAAWRSGIAPAAPAQALYYNTVTLHDGNRVVEAPALDMMSSYRLRLERLLADLDRFMGDIERAGRPTLVVFLPEHGAALRKSARSIAGLRETPWPEITHVPVAVKLIGMDAQRPPDMAHPVRVNGPTSYLSVAALLADLIALPQPWQVLHDAPDRLPRVDFVTDNGDSLVMREEGATWLRTAAGGWQHDTRPEKELERMTPEEP